MEIYDEIKAERRRQDEKWGGKSHDLQHDDRDWIAYIIRHLGKAVMWPFDPKVFRKQMIRVAALAVASVEACDLFERMEDRAYNDPERR
jgi:hypothetical protein